MDSFDLLKSLDEKHNKKADYTTLYSAQDINEITNSQRANNAKLENPELASVVLEQEQPIKQESVQEFTPSPLKLEEIVTGDTKDLEQDGDER